MTVGETIILPSGHELLLLESVESSAPLGLTFWDATLDRRVAGGLLVTATPVAGGPTIVARESSSGLYGFVHLPTTTDAEHGPVSAFGATSDYRIDVIDQLGRFAPLSTIESAPRALAAVDPIFLFSSVARPIPPGFGLIRATLQIEDTAIPAGSGLRFRPAPFAMATVSTPSGDAIGFSTGGGELAVPIPIPDLVAGIAPHEQHVIASIEIAFDPTTTNETQLVEEFLVQPVRPHLTGSMFDADGTFRVDVGTATVLSSPASSSLLLQPL